MAMQYRKVNIPVVVMENLKKKQERMQQVLFEITGKNTRIPLTKVMIAVSQKPLWLEHGDLTKLTKNKVFKI